MQLSFVYITALIAAVSASPLPQAGPGPARDHSATAPVGNGAGSPFSDLPTLQAFPTIPTITSFSGRGGVRVDQVSLAGFVGAASTIFSSIHGGGAGQASTLALTAGEFINSLAVQVGDGTPAQGTAVVYVQARTNLGKQVAVGTQVAARPTTTFAPPVGYTRLVGFSGKAGSSVDQLGPIWA